MAAEERDERLVGGGSTNLRNEPDADIEECPDRERVRQLAAERDSAIHLAHEISEDKEIVESALRREMEEHREAEATAAAASTELKLAERRANEATEIATNATFAFYLILGVLIAVLVVFVLWVFTSPDRQVVIVRPAILNFIPALLFSSTASVPRAFGSETMAEKR